DDQLITIRRPGDRSAAAAATTSSAGATPAPRPAATAVAGGPASTAAAPGGVRGPYGRVLAVPAARRLAREMNVDIEGVVGSGPNGRIRIDDVRQHAERGNGAAAGPAGRREAQPYRSPAGYADLEERTPVRGLRRVIASQMLA